MTLGLGLSTQDSGLRMQDAESSQYHVVEVHHRTFDKPVS